MRWSRTVIVHPRRFAGVWILGRRLFSFEASVENGVGDVDVECVRTELLADPLALFGVVGIGGVGEDFEKMLAAPRSATVCRGTVALSGDAERISIPISGRLGFFDGVRVFPVVAEVIGVSE